MKKITDPNLLSQLNTSGNPTENPIAYQKITDPNILQQLNKPPVPPDSRSYLQQVLDIPKDLASVGRQNNFKMANPSNEEINQLLNIAMPGGAVPKIANELTAPIAPNRYAKQIMSYLGQGAETVEQSAKSAAKDIFNNAKTYRDKVAGMLNPITKQFGEEAMFPQKEVVVKEKGRYPFRIGGKQTTKKIFDMPKVPEKGFGPEVSDFAKDFNNKPTLNNAHALQQQLGHELGSYRKMAPTPEVRQSIKELTNIRNQINGHIEDFLKNKGENFLNRWQEGRKFWEENVLPYRTNAQLKRIAEGRKNQQTKNLQNLFAHPNEDIAKVIEHMSPETKNKLLFSQLGNLNTKLSAPKLENALNQAFNSGYENLFTPETQNMLNTLSARIPRGELAKKGLTYGGLAGGLGAGAFEGINHLLDLFKGTEQGTTQ